MSATSLTFLLYFSKLQQLERNENVYLHKDQFTKTASLYKYNTPNIQLTKISNNYLEDEIILDLDRIPLSDKTQSCILGELQSHRTIISPVRSCPQADGRIAGHVSISLLIIYINSTILIHKKPIKTLR